MEVKTLVENLSRIAPRLADFNAKDPSWQSAEKYAFEIRQQFETLFHDPKVIKNLRGTDELMKMKLLIPEEARDEIAEMKITDFVLGMIYIQPYKTYENIFRGFSTEYGKELSQEARKSSNYIKTSYVYGEICFFSFADVLHLIAPSLPENAIFYDLGSGLGKVVIAASLLYPFSKVIGIEILEPLFNCSKKRQANLLKLHNESKQKCIMMAKDIDFVHGSFLTTSWADADVIFCHGTCLSDSEWSEISLAAEKLKQGAYFISTSHILHTALFEVINSRTFRMSWGTCTLYIHRRRKIGRWAAQMLRGGRATRTDLAQEQSKNNSEKENETRP